MFTVVIPLYNKELSIKNTIDSVLNQTYQDFEIIVVNDGSTDNGARIVEAINDDRIVLVHQENQGVSAARNLGIQEARYEWIALLDGDDLWQVNHLEEITKMMDIFPNEKVYVTSFEYSDKRKMFKHSRKSPIFKIDNYFKEAIKEKLMWTSIVVVNKDCFEKVGRFNVSLNRGEDLDLWARLAREYRVIKSSTITAIYKIDAENRSSSYFDIHKSCIYYYNLNESYSSEEKKYYINSITRCLRAFLGRGDFKSFILLYKRYWLDISIIALLR